MLHSGQSLGSFQFTLKFYLSRHSSPYHIVHYHNNQDDLLSLVTSEADTTLAFQMCQNQLLLLSHMPDMLLCLPHSQYDINYSQNTIPAYP
nr:MAG TPA: hypothetical protein [Caudoviricetes sp.]